MDFLNFLRHEFRGVGSALVDGVCIVGDGSGSALWARKCHFRKIVKILVTFTLKTHSVGLFF